MPMHNGAVTSTTSTSQETPTATLRLPARTRGVMLTIAVGCAATSVLLEPTARAYPVIAVLEVLVIVGFATAGYLLAQDPAQVSNGRLLMTSAVLQVITHVHLVGHSPLPMIAWLTGPLSAVPASVVLLRFPSQKLDRVALIWLRFHLTWLVVSRVLFTVPTPQRRLGWWPTVPMSPSVAAAASTIGNDVLAGSTLIFASLLVRRIARSRGVARHELVPVMVAAIGASVTVVLHLTSVASGRAGVTPLILGTEQFGLLIVPAAFLFSAVVMRMARAAVGDLLLRIDYSTTPTELQTALSKTLSDPNLQLRFWRTDTQSWVDTEGLLCDDDRTGKLRVEIADADGQPLAILLTDPAITRHSHLLNATVAACRLALHNAAALDEVRKSRARIAEAAFTERRRLERDLHDGAQQRLLALSMSLDQVRHGSMDQRTRELAEAASHQLRDAIRELRDLARGIHPAVLVQSGLGAAVDSAADRMPISVHTTIPDMRWPASTEATAYFLICEALTNVVKHSGCDAARVSVAATNAVLHVQVSDTGSGGAVLRHGSGLIGLSDRIKAIGGTFRISSSKGQGTCVEAEIPCA